MRFEITDPKYKKKLAKVPPEFLLLMIKEQMDEPDPYVMVPTFSYLGLWLKRFEVSFSWSIKVPKRVIKFDSSEVPYDPKRWNSDLQTTPPKWHRMKIMVFDAQFPKQKPVCGFGTWNGDEWIEEGIAEEDKDISNDWSHYVRFKPDEEANADLRLKEV